MTTPSGIPVFDADNHFYEPPEALTRHLPDRYRSAIAVREARERAHEARRRRQDQRVHPQPDVRRRRPPGRPGGVLPQGQPGREEPPRAVRRADQVAARLPRAGVTAGADERAGHRPHADVPDARQRHRGADEGRPAASSTPPSTRSTSGCTRPGSSTTRTASSPRRSSRCRSSRRRSRSSNGSLERGAKVVLIRPAPVPGFQRHPLVRPARVRPVLEAGRRARHPRRAALVRQRLRPDRQLVGGQRLRRCCRSSRRRSACCRRGGRSRTPSRRSIAHGALTSASPSSRSPSSRTAARGSSRCSGR